MAIKFKVIERGEPGVTGGGTTTKFYAAVTGRNKINIEQLAEDISDMSTVTAIDTRAVIESLIKLIPKYLKRGAQIDLGDFGSFYTSINSQGEDSADKVTAASIKKAKPMFRPSHRFKTNFIGLKYTKVG